jgi:hypothetical protein
MPHDEVVTAVVVDASAAVPVVVPVVEVVVPVREVVVSLPRVVVVGVVAAAA